MTMFASQMTYILLYITKPSPMPEDMAGRLFTRHIGSNNRFVAGTTVLICSSEDQ